MSQYVQTTVQNNLGIITLDRPKALNSLSLDMIRALTKILLAWRDEPEIHNVMIGSTSARAFCAGGDIRFFYDAGQTTMRNGSARIEDFFSEEYALNYLIHHYPKPYIAVMDGIVMGGGMGIAQTGPDCRLRVATERTKMAMPEVSIGLFPDVGGSFFLSRCPGEIGMFLALTGTTIGAADALYAGLADIYIPSQALPSLMDALASNSHATPSDVIQTLAAEFSQEIDPQSSMLSANRASIDRHFASDDLATIIASLEADESDFARHTLGAMDKGSPLMMSVTIEQIRRGRQMNFAECLRMERTMVRRCFEYGEVIEGIRAKVIDKDHKPSWNPPLIHDVLPELVESFFEPAWPDHAHPLRALE